MQYHDQLFFIQKRQQILPLLRVRDRQLQNIFVRNVDLAVEALFAVVFHRGDDFAEDVFRTQLTAVAAEKALVPFTELAVKTLEDVHNLSLPGPLASYQVHRGLQLADLQENCHPHKGTDPQEACD